MILIIKNKKDLIEKNKMMKKERFRQIFFKK